MAKAEIQARVLKGFRDQLPQITIPRTQMIDCIKSVFTSFGFAPIDTPALEYAEILLGKGSEETDKQLYRFQDNGKRDVALRFDLTVPLARFAAMHIQQLGTPFRRYHIAPVWRAEKPQRGRYREFIQCDFDIIGTRSMLADAEILLVINQTFKALDIKHKVRLNNRLVLNGFLQSLGARDKSAVVLRAIDKLEKLGKEVVAEELGAVAELSESQVERVFSFLDISKTSENNQTLINELRNFLSESETALEGVNQLEQICSTIECCGLTSDDCCIDLSIARGLDYYTGSVFETTLTELPEIGSICSGGRYDNLASLYTKQDLPGVGASVGLDRVLAALEELGRIEEKTSTAQILVTVIDADTAGQCMRIAQDLRAEGLCVELYPQEAKLGAQMKYADRKGINYVVLAGNDELEENSCSVKDMTSGEQKDCIPLEKLADFLKDKPGL